LKRSHLLSLFLIMILQQKILPIYRFQLWILYQLSPISWGDLIRIIHPELHDSSKAMATDFFTETFSDYLLIRSLVQLEKRNNSTIITYLVDTSAVLPLMSHYLAKMSGYTN